MSFSVNDIADFHLFSETFRSIFRSIQDFELRNALKWQSSDLPRCKIAWPYRVAGRSKDEE
jgi:hypothetical protein